MRTVIAMMMCISALSACSGNRRPEPAAAVVKPVEPDPFDHTATSFIVSGPHFAPGESAIVKVCVSPDGIISSADVVLPSGDKRFDDFAINWARQVKLANMPQSANARELCGPVRVEIRVSPLPRVLSGGDSSLG